MASFNNPKAGQDPGRLDGLNILVAEDDFVIAEYVRTVIEWAGGSAIGPAAMVANARTLAMTEPLDGAVLDIQLRDGDAVPIMDLLDSRGVPFVVLTGHAHTVLPNRFHHAPYLAKPFEEAELIRRLAEALEYGRAPLPAWRHMTSRARGNC
ncbi:response regulator [Enhydrobacter sp.]|jgi:DNA-binding response OmpR family regulator|uniref:response regulator n=1 Tax=Enhydrobacter sp. TaxID=1894999 RepID=UPI0026289F72|nr:response regulator [Enhydrobacter sp.]WIM10044.1 MAG: hypothetical protein OJF58_000997 [Enhydrobacter sp.]